VMLLDLMMPNVSGWSVIDELARQQHPLASRIIVLTAATERELSELPATTRFVRKPFELDRLLKSVRELTAPIAEVVAPLAGVTPAPAIAET